MIYSAPEIAVLGDAAKLIQSNKTQNSDAGSMTDTTGPTCELDE
jgi:hypothetical protein